MRRTKLRTAKWAVIGQSQNLSFRKIKTKITLKRAHNLTYRRTSCTQQIPIQFSEINFSWNWSFWRCGKIEPRCFQLDRSRGRRMFSTDMIAFKWVSIILIWCFLGQIDVWTLFSSLWRRFFLVLNLNYGVFNFFIFGRFF